MSTWIRSSACSSTTCVEVMFEDGRVYLRDRFGGVVVYDRDEFTAFLAGVRKGEFDLPAVVR